MSIAKPAAAAIDFPDAAPLGYVDGWLIYGRPNETIAAVRFDPRSGRTAGDAITLLEGVFWKNDGRSAATLSTSGSLIYLRSGGGSFLSLLDAHGSQLMTAPEARSFRAPTWSPDGKRIAMEVGTASNAITSAIWVFDIASGVFSRITSRVSAERPSWTGRRQANRFHRLGRSEGIERLVRSGGWQRPRGTVFRPPRTAAA